VKDLVLGLVGFGIIFLGAVLMGALMVLRRKTPPVFREIQAFTHLRQAVGRVVEDGTRLHVSLGRGALVSPQSASAFAGLTFLGCLAKLTSAGDKPPVATSGDAVLTILSQNTLQSASRASGQGVYDPTAGRLTGLTPFSYAAGAIPAIRDENICTTVLIGNFGVEAALLADAADRTDTFTLAGSDNLSAQAVLFATAQEPIIGEELYAAGAYFDAGRVHTASLTVQDILRWLIILVMLGGALLTLVGIL
jgi:hypothetical protein